jgi:hypothetical protein
MVNEKNFQKFFNALQWNSIFYVIYKISYVGFSLKLYKTVSTSYFSAWALGNSIIFLTLLWLDCGFRKSIPRYCPEFAKEKNLHKKFIYGVLLAQTIVLMLGLPLLYNTLPYFVTFPELFHVIILSFVASGLLEILKTIYHTHFWQKQFNVLHIFWILLEIGASFYFLQVTNNHLSLILLLFKIKIITSCGIIIGALLMLPTLLKQREYPEYTLLKNTSVASDFIQHSCVMWATTIIKSLSERNFLLPLLTKTIGVTDANIFKIAHESALFFQRVSLRILGRTDTILLSHIEAKNKNKEEFQKAFLNILKTVSLLCISLFALTILLFFKQSQIIEKTMFSIFLIVATGYMIEVFLSPYERVLEVKRRYKLLWIAYTPYIIGLIYLVFLQVRTGVDIIPFIASIQVLRLTGSFFMVYFSQKYYPSPFPKRFVVTVLGIAAATLISIIVLF